MPTYITDGGTALSLPDREAEVFELVGCGKSNKEIARETGLKLGTVAVYCHRLYERIGVNGRALAIVLYHHVNKV